MVSGNRNSQNGFASLRVVSIRKMKVFFRSIANDRNVKPFTVCRLNQIDGLVVIHHARSVYRNNKIALLHTSRIRCGIRIYFVHLRHDVAESRKRNNGCDKRKQKVHNRAGKHNDDALPNFFKIKRTPILNLFVLAVEAAHAADGQRSYGILNSVFGRFPEHRPHADGEFQNRKTQSAPGKKMAELVNHHQQR
ncbi:hypothetical protein SDC9_138833 [bioreactor metagenome]|uniref:Uncharacterized protein n=1 Tax=bioreactor metagenome TaxID=1076179 RepID=A0A645DQX8_9ZZZZ